MPSLQQMVQKPSITVEGLLSARAQLGAGGSTVGTGHHMIFGPSLRPDTMTFHARSRLPWIVVGVQVVLATGFLMIGVRELTGSGSWLTGLSALAIGALAAFAIVLFSSFAESTSVTIDTDARVVCFLGRLPLRQRQASWRFEEIENIEPEGWDDGEGAVLWRPVLILKNGQRVPLTSNWDRNPVPTNELCDFIRSVISR